MLNQYERYCKNKKPYWNYVILTGYIIICMLKIKQMSLFSVILLILGGFVFWSFNEYLLHRLFHVKGKAVKLLTYMIHGVHHKYVHETNNFPFLHSLLLYGIYIVLALLIDQAIVYALFIGIFLGILWLVYVHDKIHTQNSGKLGSLKTHHDIHHKHSNFNFGTTTLFWDKIFGTLKTE